MTLEELDDDNAAYIYEDKLKRKFVAVWNKLCEVTERTVTTGRPTEKRVRFSGKELLVFFIAAASSIDTCGVSALF